MAEMGFATILAVLAATGHDPPAVLVLLAFLGGASGAIGFPAFQAMVPDLVPEEDLLGAVSLSSAQFNLGRVVGPALAGLALLSHNYGLVFGINAASFAAVVVALVMVRLPPAGGVPGADRDGGPAGGRSPGGRRRAGVSRRHRAHRRRGPARLARSSRWCRPCPRCSTAAG